MALANRSLLFVMVGWAIAAGGDPWVDQLPDNWKSADVDHVLTDSPWAKAISRAGHPPGDRYGMAGVQRSSGAQFPDLQSATKDKDELYSRRIFFSPARIVRWESAAPVLEAQKRNDYRIAKRSIEWAKDYYAISVSDVESKVGNASYSWPSDAQARSRYREQAFLQTERGEKIVPANVELIETEDVLMVLYLFPRTDTRIDADDSAITFRAKLPSGRIRVKFDFRTMRYMGRLSL